ncbi:unnamed protein product [Lampetra planeri]
MSPSFELACVDFACVDLARAPLRRGDQCHARASPRVTSQGARGSIRSVNVFVATPRANVEDVSPRSSRPSVLFIALRNLSTRGWDTWTTRNKNTARRLDTCAKKRAAGQDGKKHTDGRAD